MTKSLCDCCKTHTIVEEVLVEINPKGTTQILTFEYIVCGDCVKNNRVPYKIVD